MKIEDILFKGKTESGDWVEGGFFFDGAKTYIIIRKQYIPDTIDWDIVELYEKNPVYKPYYIEVIPETVCRYTGLTDKNEKKIWENDICDRKELFPEIVKYHQGDWTLDYSYSAKRNCGDCYCNLGFYVCERNEVEVIGNIFDNPELIKGGVAN